MQSSNQIVMTSPSLCSIPCLYGHNLFMMYAPNPKAITQKNFFLVPSVMKDPGNGETHLLLCILRRDKCPTSPIYLLICDVKQKCLYIEKNKNVYKNWERSHNFDESTAQFLTEIFQKIVPSFFAKTGMIYIGIHIYIYIII